MEDDIRMGEYLDEARGTILDNEKDKDTEILQCSQNIEVMLKTIIESQEKNNKLSGYEEVIVAAFRKVPEEKKLSKFNAILDILED